MTTRLSVEHHRRGYTYRVQILVRSREHFEQKKQQLQDMIIGLDTVERNHDLLGFVDVIGQEARRRFDRTVRVRIWEMGTGRCDERWFVSKADDGMKRP